MPDTETPISPGADESAGIHIRETEPLLGRIGDASQIQGHPYLHNLTLGTGFISELAVVLLILIIWSSVLTKPLILFSGHPLAQSLGVLTVLQAILSLQPTHTTEQKRVGQWIHASLHLLGFLFLVAGTTIIEYNKIKNNGPHFHSVHAYLGVITLAVLGLQYLIGFTMWATPSLYGGRDNALAVWKYHRVSGYVILLLLLATVCSSTKTDYVKNVLKLPLWATVFPSVLIVSGVFPRIQKHKFGFRRQQSTSD